ncbi:SusD/RagB family nutrient-binding outer membrane lipoprotein [Zunongwangia sp. HRR-M8]|uniref:SusD/RagB family nutrient-binding outer membrane lipoprotein n=1 Tax=Zunongwangia sp. HRR-M8 TaxID=3015170 RepID=UPI0022DE43AD|nr:SusD/RagB family nutrient-binding outer membrane lipoprotein [Zunongwangia sp. HRR-M8]WBL21875.1 SusD/RagB family nutrient-binding outer membrane lipoprotein [Zunongwangia sp. HRR-M8]
MIHKYKIRKTLILLGIIGLIIQSCDTVDFADTNIDPDATSEPVSNGLLTYAEKYIGNLVTDELPELWIQHISEITYTETSRYGTRNYDIDTYYTNPLDNLNLIIELNSNEETIESQANYGATVNQLAVAKLLRAYIYQNLTDRWGMLPYSEALKGLENTTPVFDSQEQIYDNLFTEIDESLQLIDPSLQGPTGDQMFEGNMDRWILFGNTMKLVMALRLSNVYPEAGGYAATKFQEAINAGVIGSVNENLEYPFLTDDNNDSPWQDAFQTREDYAVSDTFIDALLEDEDPRIDEYAEYTDASVADDNPKYVGMPYGLTTSEAVADNYSFIKSEIIYDGDFPGIIYTYAQVLFSYAEAVKLGWISGDANQFYEDAIQASFDQWNASGASDYIDSVSLNNDDKIAMQQIAYEKWKALYMQGWESWFEWRRTGYPQLTPAAQPLTGTDIPVRQGYDLDWSSSNTVNYDAAIDEQGPDDLSTYVWWDEPHPITGE